MEESIDILPVEWIKEIIHLVAERLVIVDHHGIIRYMDNAYCDFLEISVEDAIGRQVQDVIENSRMHIVAKTGIAELSSVQPIKGSEMIANRYPLYVKDELVGAVGTVAFRNPQEWMDYSRRIQPLLEELNYYKTKLEKELGTKYQFSDLVGSNPKYLEAKRLAERGSYSQSSILLLGESGTGKELFAHSIHQNSTRSAFPFIRVNCASIPEHLLESELFGYESGAFTGAKKGGKKGKFEQGHMGTVFLDEIGDMPLPMQSKLLRVLQEKEIERLGGNSPKSVDVRIISATNRNLEKMVEEGSFRKDLYYRLNVIPLSLPALRDRPEDILAFAHKFLEELNRKYALKKQFSAKATQLLFNYNWPGNVRELRNVIERLVITSSGDILNFEEDSLVNRKTGSETEQSYPESTRVYQGTLKSVIKSVEEEYINQVLAECGGRIGEAACRLGIHRTMLYRKMNNKCI